MASAAIKGPLSGLTEDMAKGFNGATYGRLLPRSRWGGHLYPGSHEPIVSPELFDRVQTMFASYGRPRGPQPGHTFAFGGLMTCGVCGCSLTAMRIKDRFIYYRCTHGRGECPEGYYPERVFEPQFEAIVGQLKLAPKVVEWTRAALEQSHETEQLYRDDQVEDIRRQLDTIFRNRHISYEDRLNGHITAEFWAERNAAWKAEEARLEERLERIQKADSRYMDMGVHLLSQAERIDRLYARADKPAARRDFLATVLESATVQKGRVNPTFRPVWRLIAQMAAEKTPLPTPEQLRRYRKGHQGSAARRSSEVARTRDSTSPRPKSVSHKVNIWGPYGDEFRTVLRRTQIANLVL